jgi:signal transduction histidine kinase/tetratricopeptide (TPR) repeat protein
MIIRAITAIALVIAIYNNAAGQRVKPLIDSLERIVPIQKDSALVDVYSELAWQYRAVDRNKAINYGQKAINISRKIKYQRGLAQAYNDMGILYFDSEKYDSSIALYKEGLKIREQLNDVLGRAKLYNKIGIVYQRQGNFSMALENQLKALELFEKTGDNIGISYSLNNIGILNHNMSRYDEALDYHKRSVAIKQKINDKNGLIQSYVNLGNIYKVLSRNNEAEEYYNNALDMARVMENKEYISNVQNNLGELYIRKKDYNSAIQAISESYAIRKDLGDTKGTVSCLNHLALLYIDLGKTDTAKVLLAKAEELGLNGVNTKPELMSIYQTYSKLYETTGDIHNSLDRYKHYVAVKDTIYTQEIADKFAELETKYHTLEKDKRIQQQQLELKQNLYELTQQKLQLSEADLKIAGNELEIKKQREKILAQELETARKENALQALYRENRIKELELKNQTLVLNRRNITLFTVLALTCMGALLAYSSYRRYKLAQEAILQATIIHQQELATKAVLETEENERKRIAGDLHDTVGQMMSAAKVNLSMLESEIPFSNNEQRNAYHRVLALVDESCKEVRTVSHNIMPNALLKSGLANGIRDFVNYIDSRVLKIDLYMDGLSERLDANVEAVLYRVVQECVNNVIKHAKANKLDICVIKDQDGISITLEDNGVGFDTSKVSKHEGIGLKNIITRINYLKGTIEWNSEPGKGTLVAIHVPYEK